jgi:hypothetical protein
MPNWAYNYLTVSGSVEDMDTWRIKLANDKSIEPLLSFNKLLPLPEDMQEKWYEWRNANWGTKWDIGPDENGQPPDASSPTEYFYDFETAWSPPLEWLHNIAPNFPGLKFELGWYEEQMYFGGVTIIEDGQVIKDEGYEYEAFYNWAEDYFNQDFRPDEDWEDEE